MILHSLRFALPLALSLPALAQTLPPVLHDTPGDGNHHALGASWKASFGAHGFTYVPFFGPDASATYPLQLRVRQLRIGTRVVPLSPPVVRREGDMVWLDHGPLRERFVLADDRIEQTFVVDGDRPGDIELTVAVNTDLIEDAARPGLQFGCELGYVSYSEAFVLGQRGRLPITTTWHGGALQFVVPAALRAPGDVVIDPTVQTHAVTYQGPFGARPHGTPDVVYDASLDAYLVAWESRFSATDTDVLCQLVDELGLPIANATAAIDITPDPCTWPVVANFEDQDEFVVVVQFSTPSQAQGRSQINARRVFGAGPLLTGPLRRISDDTLPGHHTTPSVGNSDASFGGTALALVAWTYAPPGAPFSVHGQRMTSGAFVLPGPELVLASNPTSASFNASVSRSIGNDMVALEAWCVAYTRVGPAGDGDVHAVLVSKTGIGAQLVIDAGPGDAQFPHVSSPIRDPLVPGGSLECLHLVTYTRVDTNEARAAVFERSTPGSPRLFDLGTFGFGPVWLRTDADGARFVVLGSHPQVPSQLQVATFGYDGTSLLLQDGPHALAGNSLSPRLCSNRATSGPYNSYMIARVDAGLLTPTTRVTGYEGHAPGTQIAQRGTGCNGLTVGWSGGVRLGETFALQLAGLGARTPGVVFGVPTSTNVPFCGTCSFGVDLAQPAAVSFGSPTWALQIPPVSTLVGARFAVQGFSVGGSGCLGAFDTSDTFELTIR
jgi:hypothetical protein